MKYQHIQFSEPSRSSIQSGQEQVLDVQQVQKIVQEGQHDQFLMASQNQFPTDNVSINKKKIDNLRQRQLIQSSQNEYSLNDQNQMANCQNRGKNLRTKIQDHRNIKKIRKLENKQQKNKNKNIKISSYKSLLGRQKKTNNKFNKYNDHKVKFKIKDFKEQIFSQSQQDDKIELQINQNKWGYQIENKETQNNHNKWTYFDKRIISTVKDGNQHQMKKPSQYQQYVMQSSQVDSIIGKRGVNKSLQLFKQINRDPFKIQLNYPNLNVCEFQSNNIDQTKSLLNKKIFRNKQKSLNLISPFNYFENQEKQSSVQQNVKVSDKYIKSPNNLKISNQQLYNIEQKKTSENQDFQLKIELQKNIDALNMINQDKNNTKSKILKKFSLIEQINRLEQEEKKKSKKTQQNDFDDKKDFSDYSDGSEDNQQLYQQQSQQQYIKQHQQQINIAKVPQLYIKTKKKPYVWHLEQNIAFISLLQTKQKDLRNNRNKNLNKFIRYAKIKNGDKVYNRYKYYFNKKMNKTFKEVIQILKEKYNVSQNQVQQQIKRFMQYQKEQKRILQQKEKQNPHYSYYECFKIEKQYKSINYTKGELFFNELSQNIWCTSAGLLINQFYKQNKYITNNQSRQQQQQAHYILRQMQQIPISQQINERCMKQNDQIQKQQINKELLICSVKLDLQLDTNSILNKMNIIQEFINGELAMEQDYFQLNELYIDNLISQHQTLDMISRSKYNKQFNYQQYLTEKQNQNYSINSQLQINQFNIVSQQKQQILQPQQQSNQFIASQNYIINESTQYNKPSNLLKKQQASNQIILQQPFQLNQSLKNSQKQMQVVDKSLSLFKHQPHNQEKVQQQHVLSYGSISQEFSQYENLRLISFLYFARFKLINYPKISFTFWKQLSQFVITRTIQSCLDRIRTISKYANIQKIQQNIDVILQKCNITKQSFQKEVNKIATKSIKERQIVYLQKNLKRWRTLKQIHQVQKREQLIKNNIQNLKIKFKLKNQSLI